MSRTIIKRKLPSGRIPFEQIADPSVKQVLMRLNDNIQSLKAQLSAAQNAIVELQRR